MKRKGSGGRKERRKEKRKKDFDRTTKYILDYVESKVLKSQEKKEEEMSKLKFIPQRVWFIRLSVSI